MVIALQDFEKKLTVTKRDEGMKTRSHQKKEKKNSLQNSTHFIVNVATSLLT